MRMGAAADSLKVRRGGRTWRKFTPINLGGGFCEAVGGKDFVWRSNGALGVGEMSAAGRIAINRRAKEVYIIR